MQDWSSQIRQVSNNKIFFNVCEIYFKMTISIYQKFYFGFIESLVNLIITKFNF